MAQKRGLGNTAKPKSAMATYPALCRVPDCAEYFGGDWPRHRREQGRALFWLELLGIITAYFLRVSRKGFTQNRRWSAFIGGPFRFVFVVRGRPLGSVPDVGRRWTQINADKPGIVQRRRRSSGIPSAHWLCRVQFSPDACPVHFHGSTRHNPALGI